MKGESYDLGGLWPLKKCISSIIYRDMTGNNGAGDVFFAPFFPDRNAYICRKQVGNANSFYSHRGQCHAQFGLGP